MVPLTIDLRPETRNGESTLTIVLRQPGRAPSGLPALSMECGSIAALDCEIDAMKQRLEELREEGRAWLRERGAEI